MTSGFEVIHDSVFAEDFCSEHRRHLLVMEFRREIVVVRPPDWFLQILAKLGRTFGFRLT
jgi:hypothetical protein